MTNSISMIQIGAGSMGGALLKAWLDSGVVDAKSSVVIDPRPSPDLEAMSEEKGIAINPEVDGDYRLCVLGVKPQQFASVLPELSWDGFDKTLFVSIAAGITVGEIEALLKSRTDNPKVLRVMPTLPAKVRSGVSLLAENPKLTAEDREIGESLMKAAGKIYWCDDEDQLNRLMGVTGCAPAFLLRAVEGLAEAAVKQGASEEDARMLAEATFTGTANLLAADGRSATNLREAVTSPGGTTAAGLDVLNERDLVGSYVDAVERAYRRAIELAEGGKG